MGRTRGVLTFDCYGTLIDWETGIVRAAQEAAREDGVSLDAAEIVAAHAALEPAIQARGYQKYRDVLRDVARGMAGRLGWSLAAGRADFLAETLPSWPLFPDTDPALERLAADGWKLGILSNVDDDLLDGTLAHLNVAFDFVVTAERVRSYKPAHPHFLEARRRVGDGRWLHVAQSLFHDVSPATDLGIPVVWINRRGERSPSAPVPTVEVGDLQGCVMWLAAQGEA